MLEEDYTIVQPPRLLERINQLETRIKYLEERLHHVLERQKKKKEYLDDEITHYGNFFDYFDFGV